MMRLKNKTKKKDILHAGRLGVFSTSAAKYTSSIDIDGRLLSAVVSINSAHVVMLCEQGILDRSVSNQLLHSLKKVPKDLEMKDELEDVHMNVEDYLIAKVGKDVGGMLNLGKSRNDQVATALRMALREQLILLGNSIAMLEKVLCWFRRQRTQALQCRDTLISREGNQSRLDTTYWPTLIRLIETFQD